LVGSSLAQPALMAAARQSANINGRYLEPMVAILDATDVAQVAGVVVVIDMLLNLSEFYSSRSEVSALLARGTRLFNSDCVAATSATR
jgi:hypothetical protein